MGHLCVSTLNAKEALKIFPDAEAEALALAEDFFDSARAVDPSKRMSVAFSGGHTPQLFLQKLVENYADKIAWHRVHIFWVDERCVPPDHVESNYGMVRHGLLRMITIPETNVHRIRGEEDPEKEAWRYHETIAHHVKMDEGWPVFDWMLLGVGNDGHTASLFTVAEALQPIDRFCVTTRQPQTGQRRITLTLPVINHSKKINVLVSGSSKAEIMAKLFANEKTRALFPAGLVHPVDGQLIWYLDRQAAAAVAL